MTVRMVLADGQWLVRLTRSSRSEMKSTLSTCLRFRGVTATAACAMVVNTRSCVDAIVEARSASFAIRVAAHFSIRTLSF